MSTDASGFAIQIPPQLVELVARRAAQLAAQIIAAQTATDESPWLDMDGAATYLGKPLGTFKQEVTRGLWPRHREGKRVYFDRDELDRRRRERA